jgi:hypothetical protein
LGFRHGGKKEEVGIRGKYFSGRIRGEMRTDF